MICWNTSGGVPPSLEESLVKRSAHWNRGKGFGGAYLMAGDVIALTDGRTRVPDARSTSPRNDEDW
jgi:hypothetical protein